MRLSTALACSALLIAACGERAADTPASEGDVAVVPAPREEPMPPAPALTPDAERSETGARDILLDFARNIERSRFTEAWALLSDADKRKWSEAQFAALFADLGEVTVAVPTGAMEGAAGSLYYTAPVTITGTDRDGRPVRMEGEAVLRRVNDVDGASAAQLRWHFQSLTLDWTH